MNTDDFFNQWNGKFCEVEDESNKNQCFDLAFQYCDFLGVPRTAIRHLNASQIYTGPNDETIQYFEFVPNTPQGVPCKGDMIVWGGTVGHVAVSVGEGDTNSFTSFDQNWPIGSPCHFQSHDYTNVLGWLRPKNSPSSPSQTPTLTITDQTKIDCGEEFGVLEVQAIKSKLHDLTRDYNGAIAQANDIMRQLKECQAQQPTMTYTVPKDSPNTASTATVVPVDAPKTAVTPSLDSYTIGQFLRDFWAFIAGKLK